MACEACGLARAEIGLIGTTEEKQRKYNKDLVSAMLFKVLPSILPAGTEKSGLAREPARHIYDRKPEMECKATESLSADEGTELVRWLFAAKVAHLAKMPEEEAEFARLLVKGAGVAALNFQDPEDHGRTPPGEQQRLPSAPR